MCGCSKSKVRYRWVNPTTGRVYEFATQAEAEQAVAKDGGNYQAVLRAAVLR